MNLPVTARSARRTAWWTPLLALAAACAVPALMYQLLGGVGEGRWWAVDEVELVGAERLSEDEVLAIVGLDRPRNVLSCHPSRMEEALEAHPWIAHAQVYVSLTGHVSLRVVEREPALVVLGDGATLVDSAGVTIRPWSPLEDVDIPMFIPSSERLNDVVGGAGRVHAARRLADAWAHRAALPPLREIHDLGVHGWRVVDAAGVETLLPPRHPARRLAAVERVRADAAARSLRYHVVRADGATPDRITLATLAPEESP